MPVGLIAAALFLVGLMGGRYHAHHREAAKLEAAHVHPSAVPDVRVSTDVVAGDNK